MIMDDKQRIDKLRTELLYHGNLYYNLDAAEITDSEYDDMYRELEALEAKNPDYLSETSPTQVVGAKDSGDVREKVKHRTRMGSLRNIKSADDIRKWFARIKSVLEDKMKAAGIPLPQIEESMTGAELRRAAIDACNRYWVDSKGEYWGTVDGAATAVYSDKYDMYLRVREVDKLGIKL